MGEMMANVTLVGDHRVPEGDLQAALFDVDGTLVDSMSRWIPYWNEAGAQFGIVMTDEDFWSMAGWPLPDMIRKLHRDQKDGQEATDEFVEAFLEVKRAVRLRREEEAGAPPAIEPVVAIARAHVERGVPIVAATSGNRDAVEHHLSANGLMELFPSDRIICAADLPPGRGKPHPDIFLRAAELAGADPRRCVVYEDAESGFQGAWRAGCQVVDVRELPGYPMSAGLREAMERQRACRTWLKAALVGKSAVEIKPEDKENATLAN